MTERMEWSGQIRLWKFVRVFGLGALIAGAVTVAMWLVVAAVAIALLAALAASPHAREHRSDNDSR